MLKFSNRPPSAQKTAVAIANIFALVSAAVAVATPNPLWSAGICVWSTLVWLWVHEKRYINSIYYYYYYYKVSRFSYKQNKLTHCQKRKHISLNQVSVLHLRKTRLIALNHAKHTSFKLSFNTLKLSFPLFQQSPTLAWSKKILNSPSKMWH